MSNTNDKKQPINEAATLSPEAMHNLVQFITTLMEMDKQYEELKKWNSSNKGEAKNDN